MTDTTASLHPETRMAYTHIWGQLGLVQVALDAHGMSLKFSLTPGEAREFAGAFVATADALDAQVADVAWSAGDAS